MKKTKKYLILLLTWVVFVVSGCISVWASEGKTAENFHGQKFYYNETDQAAVTVTVTFSSDGIPIMGASNTALSALTVQVPYFDLKNYDMEQFYRYKTNEKCEYINSEVVKRPTLLHLFIYMSERYCLGYASDQCGKGLGKKAFQAERYDDVYNIFGEAAYSTFNENTGDGRSILKFSGTPKSLYMTNFWGHDENLNYYVNHKYPVVWTDWGASSDYITLSDGDVVDLAMFSDWSWYTKGGFSFFNRNVYQAQTGERIKIKTYFQGGSRDDDNDGIFTTPDPVVRNDLQVYVYDSDWRKTEASPLVYDYEDCIFYTFCKPGTYYLLGMERNAGSPNASIAPAVSKVTVTGEAVLPEPTVSVTPEPTKAPVPTQMPASTPTPVPTKVPTPTPVPTKAPTPVPELISTTNTVVQTKAASDSVTVSWKADRQATAGYAVYIKGDVWKTYQKVKTVLPSKKSCTISVVGKKKLRACKTYSVKVVSLKKSGNRIVNGKQQILSKAGTVSAAPVIKKITRVKSGTAKLVWKKISGVSGIQIQMSNKPKSNFKTVKTIKNATGYTKTGLKKGQTVYFRIRTYRVINGKKYYSSWSKVGKVKG